MKQARTQLILFAFLALPLIASLLVACDEEQPVPVPPETIKISGRVLEMPLQAPLAGATVQLIANDIDTTDPNYERRCDCEGDLCSFRTTSDGEGRWTLEVPVKYNPETHKTFDLLIRASQGRNPPGYNVFALATGDQSDLQILNSLFYFLFGLDALIGGADPDDLSVIMGVAIGFADMEYPQQIATLPGVTVSAKGGSPAAELPITYLGETGLPDPGLTETSALGVYYFAVPDANDSAMPLIDVSGTAPGLAIVGGYYPACPGSFTGVAVIDPYYRP